jgi:uncharacterized membrane protein
MISSVQRSRSARNVGALERRLSVLGGTGLLVAAVRRRAPDGLLLGLAGSALVARGLTGRCGVYRQLGISSAGPETRPRELPVRVETAVVVNRPAPELYAFWRDFTNLPRFMEHLEAVRLHDGDASHWVARTPAGTVEWDARIVNEVDGKDIGWEALPGSDVDHAGSVNFRPAPGGRGTEVRVVLRYAARGGYVGARLAEILGASPDQAIERDLRRFKQLMEAGEIATAGPAPAGAAA